MDTIGFVVATAFLATVFTVFGVIDRLLVGLVSELRYTVAPGIASGVRAWGEGPADVPGTARSSDDDQASGETGGTEPRSIEPEAPAPTMPVRPVTRHTWLRFARLPRASAGVGH